MKKKLAIIVMLLAAALLVCSCAGLSGGELRCTGITDEKRDRRSSSR